MRRLLPKDAILLDTDVFSYVTRQDPQAQPYLPYLSSRLLCLSFATVAEVYKGAYKAGWGETRLKALEGSLRNFVVVPYDFEISRICGRLMAEMQGQGRSMQEFDAWIASTAIRHDLPLATNNRKHFNGVPGLRLVP